MSSHSSLCFLKREGIPFWEGSQPEVSGNWGEDVTLELKALLLLLAVLRKSWVGSDFQLEHSGRLEAGV
jgi:hypothetical protein